MNKKSLFLLIIPLLFSCAPKKEIEVKKFEIYLRIIESGEFISPLNTEVSLTSYLKYNASTYQEICKNVENTIWNMHYIVDSYRTYENIDGIESLNNYYGKGALKVDPLLINLLDTSFTVCELTKGLFNPTLGCLIDTWKPYFDSGKVYSSIRSE